MTGLLAAPLAVITTAAPAHAATVDVQILATNDFHGRLADRPTGSNNPEPIEIASVMSGAVKQLRAANPNTIFAAGGDMIGASTFESFIQRDKPTIDVLNEAGLDVSAAGNHEFDGGYNDLVNRVMKPASAANPEGGAEWQYLAANVRKKSDGTPALPDVEASPGTSDGATWMTTTTDGVDVGFVGAVTEDLPSLVSPSGIADLQVTSIIDETNKAADALKAAGADVVVLLVHEGAPTTKLEDASTNDNAFSRIVKGVDSDVNAIVSGHTHLAYNHFIGGRPVVSAGQYGANLNQLVFTVDTDPDGNPATDDSTVTIDPSKQKILPMFGKDPDGSSGPAATPPLYPVDAATKALVDDAFTKANELGAKVLGKVGGAFNRAKLADGSENRGGESTLGNLVAEVQRWATESPLTGAAQIAFMNPGGLRADMTGAAGGYPANLTYKQAAVVQPFANTLVNMKMTGAQIKTVLEQQWQRDDKGNVPQRPFLRLGTSKGFFATYDPAKPEGNRVTSMSLNGKAIEPATSYSVTVNSFLAGGGDNFVGFRAGTARRDTGKVDLQAMVDYMAAKAATTPLTVDKEQHQVGVSWPASAPRFYRIGQELKVNLSSLAMSTAADAKDAALNVKLGNATLDAVTVDNTIGTDPFDEYGKAAVALRLKGKVKTGKQLLTFTGPTTGTTFSLPVDVRKGKPEVTVRAKPKRIVAGKTRARIKIKAEALGIKTVTGKVVVKVGGKKYTVKLKKGKAVVKLAKFTKAGKKRVVVKYAGTRKVRSKTAVVKLKVRRG
ncbi:5'-nucleotidase C-terminal domain-containing protein [Microbacterium sp. ARD31]|uniref:bifunctional metallophosphatase/5'-nucleotidase n=1 Tax=Microbacterium sp. ARD31 TaxID=2962576 RepID=UPI0028813CCB|nr:5'-nucleotidase C-terminal domain-containing protein [Microbacterium sp. ARD31]MDT0187873.1 5'-nucleotidase C-terminal domain-containing protein [Microbacterium sp. ARD31]